MVVTDQWRELLSLRQGYKISSTVHIPLVLMFIFKNVYAQILRCVQQACVDIGNCNYNIYDHISYKSI